MTGSFVEGKIYRSYALIDLKAIKNNIKFLKKNLHNGVMALAVVKANAYGHGALRVAKYIESDVDYFAVATDDEAIELRKGGIIKPILVLSCVSPDNVEELISLDITLTVYDSAFAKKVSYISEKLRKCAKIHIAIDTGMGRIGFFPCDEAILDIEQISKLKNINLEGIFSHYATADSLEKEEMIKQGEIFKEFIACLEKRNINIPIKHIANSAAIVNGGEQFNMCRMGISMYGLFPSDDIKRLDNVKLIPAMSLISHVIHIKSVTAGFQIGYGHTYTASSERKIATVSIGYADGFRRCLSNMGEVLIRGKRARVVGRVCMDQIMLDVTDIDGVSVGDEVVIIGNSESEQISAEELAAMCNTINYEIVCGISPRVQRIYRK